MADTISTLAAKLRPHWLRDLSSNITAVSAAGTPGVTDHGALSGLFDDDHPQYLTPVRGDARYIPSTRQITAGAGLTGGGDLSADRSLALTTPGTLTVSSTNTATGSHTHAITASSDVGTSPAAALLKSTAGGALTLSSLFVKGSVDISNNGDLTVAGSGSYAGSQVLFADSSGGNVGILMTPDPQFALDVNGPARATYFVGPHAIQLKNVLLLAHYDGRAPYATNYSGEPNGHMGQIATVTGGVIYRPGKFYKAAQFAPAATNLITNPTFANASFLAGWTSYNTPTTAASTQAYIGTNGAYVQSAGAGAIGFSLTGLTPGTWYTASVYIASSSTFPTPYLCNASFGGVVNATLQTTTDDGWRRYVAYKQAEADGTLRFILPGTSGGVVYSNAQMEQSAFVTPWCSGALGDGHAWTGTANASTSTRTAATLNYPAAGNISSGAGTIMAWVWVDQLDVSTSTHTILDAGTAFNYCALFMNSGTTPTAYIGGAGGTVTATGPAAAGTARWVHVAVTWGGGAVTVYTNGTAGTPVAYSNAPTFHTAISVGYYRNLGNRQLNGYIDDLCILERAMPASEVRSVYESNAPVFAETSTFSFRPTPKGLLWADDEGLWMKATDGDTVLGIYGNDAQTKSWGGQTMSAGDLLIGNATNYVFWNDDVATLTISGTVTAGAGAIGGWTIGATALTAGSGANTVGLDSGGTNPAIYAGSATPGSAPFRVTKTGALTATSATVAGDFSVASSTFGTSGVQMQYNSNSPRFYVGDGANAFLKYETATGYPIASGIYIQGASYVTGSVYAGNSAVRLSTDGQRLVLPNLTSIDVKTDIPTSSSAIRWFAGITDTWTSAANYTGQISYRSTGTTKAVDWAAMSYVGSTDYATYYARSMLYANRYNGSANKTCRVEAAVDPGAGGAYVTLDCDTAYTTAAMYVATNMSALSITDRTPHYEGDALAELRLVRGKTRTVKGKSVREIDHDTLPAFARVQVVDARTKESRDERDLGAMISILTVAVQQLDARLDALEVKGNGRK